jgi:hypothetical protein
MHFRRRRTIAAYPGQCSVMAAIEWEQLDEPTDEDLIAAELHLRELAFPMVAERLAKQTQ